MKRVLTWIGVVFLVLIAALGIFFYVVFGDASPIVDGREVVPGVVTVKDGFVSVFVLESGPGKVVLVDAGNDEKGTALLAALSTRGLTPASVSAILLTHGHRDHVAGCKLFPSAEVYAMDNEQTLIGDAAKVTHPLKDGDAFDVGELHVEAFAVPGHTDGSAVYFARGVLFFGDSAGATKDGKVAKAVGIFTKDSPQNVASLKALSTRLQPRSAEVKELAFAHSGPLDGFAPLAAFAAAN